MQKMLTPAKQLDFIVCAHGLRDYALGRCKANEVMEKLEVLPGLNSYGYHVLRSWTVCILGRANVPGIQRSLRNAKSVQEETEVDQVFLLVASTVTFVPAHYVAGATFRMKPRDLTPDWSFAAR